MAGRTVGLWKTVTSLLNLPGLCTAGGCVVVVMAGGTVGVWKTVTSLLNLPELCTAGGWVVVVMAGGTVGLWKTVTSLQVSQQVLLLSGVLQSLGPHSGSLSPHSHPATKKLHSYKLPHQEKTHSWLQQTLLRTWNQCTDLVLSLVQCTSHKTSCLSCSSVVCIVLWCNVVQCHPAVWCYVYVI